MQFFNILVLVLFLAEPTNRTPVFVSTPSLFATQGASPGSGLVFSVQPERCFNLAACGQRTGMVCKSFACAVLSTLSVRNFGWRDV
jgi:hypothetical protein